MNKHKQQILEMDYQLSIIDYKLLIINYILSSKVNVIASICYWTTDCIVLLLDHLWHCIVIL